MKIIQSSYEILTPISEGGEKELRLIEKAARQCYGSEHLMTDDISSATRLIRALVDRKHEAMLEHSMLSVLFIVDRGISHEIVRHREASYAQESTRFCNYSKGKYGREITVIAPATLLEGSSTYALWKVGCEEAETAYFDLLDKGLMPEQARAVLPTSLKTSLVMTANYREWRHVLKLRTAKDAHPDMRAVMVPLLKELAEKLPDVFGDIWEDVVSNWEVRTHVRETQPWQEKQMNLKDLFQMTEEHDDGR